jgi:hypothetical protein
MITNIFVFLKRLGEYQFLEEFLYLGRLPPPITFKLRAVSNYDGRSLKVIGGGSLPR